MRTFVRVVVHKHNVQVAAVTQLFTAQLAVGNDGDGWLFAVAVLQAAPAPAGRHAQHGIGQRAQVVSHLLHREHTFYVSGQRAELLGMVGTAQQVEQAFLVVFAGPLQGHQARLQLTFKLGGIETAVKQVAAGQLVNDTRVLQQIACGPLGRTQQTEQALIN